jgi:hypothetical protein
MEEAVRKVAKNTIGYTRKQAGKEWFDEECKKVNDEKTACRANAFHKLTRVAQDKYRLARSIEGNFFKEKSRQQTRERFATLGRVWLLGSKTFEVIIFFVYCGYLVTPNNGVSLEIQRVSSKCNKILHLQDLNPRGRD